MRLLSPRTAVISLTFVFGFSAPGIGVAQSPQPAADTSVVAAVAPRAALVNARPAAGRTVRPRQTIRLRFNREVAPTSATIRMAGLRRTVPARRGANARELKVRLPGNLSEARKVAVDVHAAGSRVRIARVVYRARFKLRRTRDRTLIVTGSDPARGFGGRTIRYTLEVQPSLRRRAGALIRRATKVLNNQRRGWTALGQRRLKRVSNPARAHIRVLLAKPRTVDALCARSGLYTAGIYSCWNSEFAALNLMRWKRGARGFKSITQYRNYLVNHEFGHGLGYGHVRCTGSGRRAPVMEQQSITLRGCRANGWPYR